MIIGTDDFCIAMDQSDRSYQLLGKYAAGQHLYGLESDLNEIIYIVFCSGRSYGSGEPPVKVKLPTLLATEEHLMACQYNWIKMIHYLLVYFFFPLSSYLMFILALVFY